MNIYDPINDAWMAAPSPALAGTYAAGASACRHPWGPRGTATAGTTTTITTNLNLQRSLKGYKVRIEAGPNAGQERTILSNTTGTNSVITVDTPYATAITNSSAYVLITGRVYVLGSGTLAAGSFKCYDVATNTWNTLAHAGLAATIATDGKLVPTPGYLEDFDTGTATSATSTTLTSSGKTWTTNTYAGYQVKISSGTGAGQIRVITSNTATTLTVPTWTITPDATSTFELEGNSDAIYFLGNNAVTMYRYSVAANTWTTITPTVARAGAPVAGMSANWVWEVTDSTWTNPSNPLNGQYIYSFRGTTGVLDRYNITTNAWENDIVYSPKAELFISGTAYNYIKDHIYIMLPTGRLLKYNINEQRIEPSSQLWYTQSTVHLGDRLFDVSYTDGGTELRWIYFLTHNQNTLFRMLLF